MTLGIVGYGLVSPGGLTPRDHAFFVHSGVLTPAPSPFVTRDDERVDVGYCSWLGAEIPVAERLQALALTALRSALSDPDIASLPPPSLVLVVSPPREGLLREDVQALRDAAAKTIRADSVAVVFGEAAAFKALAEIDTTLPRDAPAPVVVLAVDSFVSPGAIDARVRFPPSPWAMDPVVPSEAAAAVAILRRDVARRARVEVLGLLRGAAAAQGDSNDENDLPVDGTAMTAALRALPRSGPFSFAFGQDRVDSLRKMEWHIATARNASLFDPNYAMWTPETEIGRVGAAAGLLLLVHGLAMLRHRTVRGARAASGAPACAWAISPDGTRGAASFTEGES